MASPACPWSRPPCGQGFITRRAGLTATGLFQRGDNQHYNVSGGEHWTIVDGPRRNPAVGLQPRLSRTNCGSALFLAAENVRGSTGPPRTPGARSKPGQTHGRAPLVAPPCSKWNTAQVGWPRPDRQPVTTRAATGGKFRTEKPEKSDTYKRRRRLVARALVFGPHIHRRGSSDIQGGMISRAGIGGQHGSSNGLRQRHKPGFGCWWFRDAMRFSIPVRAGLS